VNFDERDTVLCLCFCLHVCSGPVSHIWALNANSSKMVKATVFKFDRHVSRDSPDGPREIFAKRGRGQGHVTPLNFWALSANSYKTLKAIYGLVKITLRVYIYTLS